MKLTIAIETLLSGLALAADKLPIGAACDTNVNCNNNCLDGRWTIANRGGADVFVCDPKNTDSPLYFRGQCIRISTIAGFPIQSFGATKTATACNKLGGESCKYGCVITGSKLAPDASAAMWKQACLGAGAQEIDITSPDNRYTRERAEAYAQCEK